jgi:arginine-tRNA-protein transferase
VQILHPPRIEDVSDCPYLPGRRKRFASFLAGQLSPAELSGLLASGWRKFGVYFFRPDCPGCSLCLPLRVSTAEFRPSRSQRRLLRRSARLSVEFGPLRPTDRMFEIYRAHSLHRFGQEADLEEFLLNFFLPSCPGLQSEIRLDGELVGTGFLDRGEDCLSSVYFCFDPRHGDLGLGTLGVLMEIEYARSLGLPWYYLGYYVPGCPSMAYKDHFRPREHFDRRAGIWRQVAGPPEGLSPVSATESAENTGR